MATTTYMGNRKKYTRPQAILFSDSAPEKVILNEGTENESFMYVPPGVDVASADYLDPSLDNFLILSDHNRGEISFSSQRIEEKKRMINGKLRSYHIADKLRISVNWDNLPSRSFSTDPDFNSSGTTAVTKDGKYTVDGGAGGADLLDWYENHTGSFWVYLAYDKPSNFAYEANPYGNLAQYTEFVEVFFSDFQYSVVKRGANTHDFWSVSLSLEEV